MNFQYPLALLYAIVSFFVVSVLASSAQGGETLYADSILAVVEDEVITVSMVMRETAPMEMTLARRLPADEYRGRVSQLRSLVLDELINRELAYAEYRERDRQIPDSYIRQQIDEIIRRETDGDEAEFEFMLQSQGMSFQQFREQIERQMAIEAVIGEVRRRSQVSRRGVKRFYDENKDEFPIAEAVKIKRILISPPRQVRARREFQQKVEGAAQWLRRGGEFKLIGLAVTDRPAYLEPEWVEIDDLDTLVAEMAQQLPLGEVSPPVNTAEGVYFIKIEEKRGEKIQDFSVVRNTIEDILYCDRLRQQRDEFMSRLRDKFYVEIYE